MHATRSWLALTVLCTRIRLQGCCHRIIEARCKRVYIGAMEPAHFQICEGVRIMQEAGIDVIRLSAREYHIASSGDSPAHGMLLCETANRLRRLWPPFFVRGVGPTAGLEEECLAPNRHVLSSS